MKIRSSLRAALACATLLAGPASGQEMEFPALPPIEDFLIVAPQGLAPQIVAREVLAPIPPAAARGKALDLSYQFGDPPRRTQCDIGACHAFSSVAVLEAAYFRRYGRHIRLSEADLFIQRKIVHGSPYRDFLAQGKCAIFECGESGDNLAFALANGVAESVNYDSFRGRYQKWRNSEETYLRGLRASRERVPWYVKLVSDPRADQAHPSWGRNEKRSAEERLSGDSAWLTEERRRVKALFEGFEVEEERFKHLSAYDIRGFRGQCAREGVAQRDAIVRALEAGQPVVVGMNLSGLAAWGESSGEDGWHEFVITGYASREGSEVGLVFKTRNSWGGKNPTVDERELCRVDSVITVLAPAETMEGKFKELGL